MTLRGCLREVYGALLTIGIAADRVWDRVGVRQQRKSGGLL